MVSGIIRIGLTGNFGTGKSTVARIFRQKGVRVLSADRMVHEVFRKGNPVYPKIRSLFRELKGHLTRRRLAAVVFGDPRKRRALESLIHPYVLGRIREEIRKTHRGVVVVEIPLLFESGYEREVDRTIVVTAPREKARKRLLRKGFKASEVDVRWRVQMPLSEKVRRADERIDNSDGREKTRRQAVQILKKLERSLIAHGQRKK